ncbi:hypothetical protein [Nocardia sp. NPDC056000]|uniref:hypothetical protein n=1 Tax=Nocardia sp. NPDC056000 TaxID=3345674 RepID=UPI0035E0F345
MALTDYTEPALDALGLHESQALTVGLLHDPDVVMLAATETATSPTTYLVLVAPVVTAISIAVSAHTAKLGRETELHQMHKELDELEQKAKADREYRASRDTAIRLLKQKIKEKETLESRRRTVRSAIGVGLRFGWLFAIVCWVVAGFSAVYLGDWNWDALRHSYPWSWLGAGFVFGFGFGWWFETSR